MKTTKILSQGLQCPCPDSNHVPPVQRYRASVPHLAYQVRFKSFDTMVIHIVCALTVNNPPANAIDKLLFITSIKTPTCSSTKMPSSGSYRTNEYKIITLIQELLCPCCSERYTARYDTHQQTLLGQDPPGSHKEDEDVCTLRKR
jgi:hypothetical protein